MTSRDISALVGSRHDNVKVSIDRLIERGVISNTALQVFEEINNLGLPVRREQYVFSGEQGKRDSIVVVAQLSPEFTARLVDRWQELEAQQPRLPQTFAEALRLAADQAEQLAIAAPKAQVYDRIIECETLLNATQVAQPLGISARRLNTFLEELDVYNRSITRGRAFQQWFIDCSFGEMKQTESGYPQPLFTTKGQMWIINEYQQEHSGVVLMSIADGAMACPKGEHIHGGTGSHHTGGNWY